MTVRRIVKSEEALTMEKREAPSSGQQAAAGQAAAKRSAGETLTQTCMRCGRTEMDAPLLPVRTQGESAWVCVKCLPALIHG